MAGRVVKRPLAGLSLGVAAPIRVAHAIVLRRDVHLVRAKPVGRSVEDILLVEHRRGIVELALLFGREAGGMPGGGGSMGGMDF